MRKSPQVLSWNQQVPWKEPAGSWLSESNGPLPGIEGPGGAGGARRNPAVWIICLIPQIHLHPSSSLPKIKQISGGQPSLWKLRAHCQKTRDNLHTCFKQPDKVLADEASHMSKIVSCASEGLREQQRHDSWDANYKSHKAQRIPIISDFIHLIYQRSVKVLPLSNIVVVRWISKALSQSTARSPKQLV